jgi:hypothetical protein
MLDMKNLQPAEDAAESPAQQSAEPMAPMPGDHSTFAACALCLRQFLQS